MSEKISPVDDIEHVAGAEATLSPADAGFSHVSETPEPETAPTVEGEISHIEGKEAATNEPPEAISNVSEVVGIAEEQLAEINMLGDVSRDLHLAQYTLGRIGGLDPERLKPYEKKIVAERKEYTEQFIDDAKAYKAETVKAGVETIRSLPLGSEIEKMVQLDDAAIIAEFKWRKKDKNQPLSLQEEQMLKEAFQRREIFFDKLKILGVDSNSARPLYDHILADKALEFQKRLSKESDRSRKIEEAQRYFASQKENVVEEGIFFDPELLAAIEADNVKSEQEETDKDTRDLQALTDEAFVAQTFSSDDVPNFVSPEMVKALKENKIHVKDGKELTASEALRLRRKVLGKRGSEDIERMEKHVAERTKQKNEEQNSTAASIEIPIVPPLTPEAASTQESVKTGSAVVKFGDKSTFTPREKSPHTDLVHVQEEYFTKLKELRDAMNNVDSGAVNYSEEIERLEEEEAVLTRHYDEQLNTLGFEKEKASPVSEKTPESPAVIDYDDQWEIMSEQERQKIIEGCRAVFNKGEKYRIRRTSGAIEEWTLFEIFDHGVARMFSPDGNSHKDVSLLELRSLNLTAEAPGVPVGKLHAEEGVIASSTPEATPKEHREINHAVAKQFLERFGLDDEDLLGIEGFTELSPNQQLLVLENFSNTAAKDISVEGLKSYKENLTKSGLWGRAWKTMTKQYQLGKEKGVRREEWHSGGSEEILAMKKDTLSGLTKLALTQKEFDVTQTERGLEVLFASPKFFEGKELTSEEQETIARFNDAANRYANLDFSGGDKKEEDLRALAEKEYQTALQSMTEIYVKHQSILDGVAWQHKVRSAVQMNRFFADNPELEKDLNRSAGMTTFLSGMNTLTERSAIAGAGFGLRVAAVGALGTLGLFVAAPVVGWTLGARRAKQSIAEKDLLARMGLRDTSDDVVHKQLEKEDKEGSKQVVNAKDVAKNIINAEVLAEKLTESLRELEKVSDTEIFERAKRDGSGALVRDAFGKVEKESVSKKTQLLESLDARIEYTKRKLEDELVNLGATNVERITAVNDLMEAIGHAEARVALEDPATNDVLSERLDNFLDIRKEKIEDNRKHAVKKEAIKGAAFSLGFAAAGSGIGWAVRHGIDTGWFGGGAKQPAFSPEAVGTIKHPSGVPQGVPPLEHTSSSAVVNTEAIFTEEYVRNFNDNISHIIGANTSRAPLSIEELDALRQTAGLEGAVSANAHAYNALIYEMRKSPVALSNETIQKIISNPKEYIDPSGMSAYDEVVNGATRVEDAPSTVAAQLFEATPKAYTVGRGDTLTSILKAHVSEVRALSSDGQENAIQNFVKSLNTEDLKQIGLGTDPDKLAIGQSVNLERVVQLLHEKQVGGVDILKHAEALTTPNEGVIEGGALDTHTSGAIAEAVPQSSGASVSTEAVTMNAGAHTVIQEAVAPPNGATTSRIASETQAHWHDLPQAVRLPQAAAEAQRYLEADISKLYGPPSEFGYWPREWTSLSARGATQVLNQTKETITTSDAPGYQWSVVNKMQQYIREQGFTKEYGFVPKDKENIADFIKRAHAEKIMSEGPSRLPQGK